MQNTFLRWNMKSCRGVLVTRGERIYFATVNRDLYKKKINSIVSPSDIDKSSYQPARERERSVVYHVAGYYLFEVRFIYLLLPVYLVFYPVNYI